MVNNWLHNPEGVCVLSHFCHVLLFVTPSTIACQAPLSLGFPRQEYWSGLPFPPPGDLPNSKIKPTSPMTPALKADTLPLCHQGSPILKILFSKYHREDLLTLNFPGGATVKNLPANAGDPRDAGSIPGLWRSPGVGNGNPPQYFCLENPMDRWAWQATVHWASKSQTRLSVHTHTYILKHVAGNHVVR